MVAGPADIALWVVVAVLLRMLEAAAVSTIPTLEGFAASMVPGVRSSAPPGNSLKSVQL